MEQKEWLGTRVMKHKYYHSEDPKYGWAFQIVAVQFESIENEKFSDWIEEGDIQFGDGISINFYDYLKKLRKMGKTYVEWKKMKDLISDDLCRDINRMLDICTNLGKITRVKDVVAYKVHYLGDSKNEYQIL